MAEDWADHASLATHAPRASSYTGKRTRIAGHTHHLSPPYLFLHLSIPQSPFFCFIPIPNSSPPFVPPDGLLPMAEGGGRAATVGRALRAGSGGSAAKALDHGASQVAARPATASYVAAGVDWLGDAATAVSRSCNRGRRKLEPQSSGAARLLRAGKGVLQPWPRKAGSVVRRSYNQVRWSCEVNQSFFASTVFFFATTVSDFCYYRRCHLLPPEFLLLPESCWKHQEFLLPPLLFLF